MSLEDELTYEEAWAAGQPLPDFYCATCGEPYSYNCKSQHRHAGWLDCVNVCDIRQLHCGCYAHKDCAKSGPPSDDAKDAYHVCTKQCWLDFEGCLLWTGDPYDGCLEDGCICPQHTVGGNYCIEHGR